MKNNLKAIGILLSLSIVWSGLYSVASIYKTVNSVEAVEIETKVGQNAEDIVTDIVSEDIEPVEGICPECKQIQGEVLGDTDGCSSVFNELITTPVFINGSGDVDFKNGDKSGDSVSKKAKIEVSLITVPAVLLGGSSQVKDSNKIPNMDSASLKAAGDIFDVDYGRKLESPYSAKEYDSAINEAVYKKRFGSEAEMKFAQTEGEGSIADINIETSEESICLDCQDSNYNPDRSNNIADNVNDTMSIPGGQKRAPLNEEESLTIESGIVENLPEAQTACKRKLTSPLSQLFAKISTSIFNQCRNEDAEDYDPSKCIRVKDIVIRTNSFFGDYDTCKNDGKCTNTFMNRRSMVTLSPIKASEFDQNFLVETACAVLIDGKQYSVPCLWDVSYIATEYYYQWQNKNPGKEFPAWSVFWEAIEKDLLERD